MHHPTGHLNTKEANVETEECLAKSIEHQYHYSVTEFGLGTWICNLCNNVVIEYEDAVL